MSASERVRRAVLFSTVSALACLMAACSPAVNGTVPAPVISAEVSAVLASNPLLAEWTGPQGGVPMGKFLEVCKDVSGSDATFTWCDAEFLREQNLRPWAELPMWADPSDPEMGGVNQWDISRSIEAGLIARS